MIIAVSGNVGSGKTTLAKYISDAYGFIYVPQRRFEFDFIDDFFDDIEGKFFPAQVSFLLSKAIELQELYSQHNNIVIDRSLLEDIEVFARLWIENKQIDSKIVQLYWRTAEFIKTSVPSPTIYIVCKCPAEVSLSRIDQREKRRFEDKYPPNHVQMLERYYDELAFDSETPYVIVDTTFYDFTKKNDIELVCKEIFDHVAATQESVQLSLFEDYEIEQRHITGMEFHNFSSRHPIFISKQDTNDYIYLAAPFTQVAEEIINAPTEMDIFSEVYLEKSYGELPNSYKRVLLKIKKSLEKKYEKNVFIPHKEINNWGRTTYSSEYLAPRIINSVKNASAVVSIPGNSLGVHLELGIAIAHRKPVVIFDVDEFPCGYLIRGFAESNMVRYIRLSSIKQISTEIKRNDIFHGLLKMENTL